MSAVLSSGSVLSRDPHELGLFSLSTRRHAVPLPPCSSRGKASNSLLRSWKVTRPERPWPRKQSVTTAGPEAEHSVRISNSHTFSFYFHSLEFSEHEQVMQGFSFHWILGGKIFLALGHTEMMFLEIFLTEPTPVSAIAHQIPIGL